MVSGVKRWMDICFCAHQEWGVEEEASFLKENTDRYADMHRALLNFPESVRIYDDRVGFYQEFARRFQVEATGDVYRMNEIFLQ